MEGGLRKSFFGGEGGEGAFDSFFLVKQPSRGVEDGEEEEVEEGVAGWRGG